MIEMLSTSTMSRGDNLVKLLDTIPLEVRLEHILPHLSPETLVWLNREFYTRYHFVTKRMINIGRSNRFPLGKWDTYVRHMVRCDSSFVLSQTLKDNAIQWSKMINYYYKGKTFPSYLHYLFHYSLDMMAAKCRKRINDVAIEVIGKKWYKKTREKSDRWSN